MVIFCPVGVTPGNPPMTPNGTNLVVSQISGWLAPLSVTHTVIWSRSAGVPPEAVMDIDCARPVTLHTSKVLVFSVSVAGLTTVVTRFFCSGWVKGNAVVPNTGEPVAVQTHSVAAKTEPPPPTTTNEPGKSAALFIAGTRVRMVATPVDPAVVTWNSPFCAGAAWETSSTVSNAAKV